MFAIRQPCYYDPFCDHDNEVQVKDRINPHTLYLVFKYSIYLLLTMNLYHFFSDEHGAFALTFADGYTLKNIFVGYNATIDTLAWLLLLYLFELETFILDDDVIVGWVKWSMHGIRTVCYFFLVSAFYNYIERYFLFTGIEPFQIDDVCTLVGTSYTYAFHMDEYIPWTQEICQMHLGEPLFRYIGTDIIAPMSQSDMIIRLAWIDITNSGTWLIVVLILEIDVWLQIQGKLTPRIMLISKWIKLFLYLTLFACLGLWLIDGDLLDIGDAFLWLLGFFFIELNLFDWNAETTAESAAA